mmetsp:Transcript_10452/g.29851  ORF Transcript_10452/g.29851 Transcript_10452/m.29851 type:complete len:285 (-) Transcript_10452:2602-3456(-)
MHHWKSPASCKSIEMDKPKMAGSMSNHPLSEKRTARKLTKPISKNMMESMRKPTHRDAAMKEKKARVWLSCVLWNFLVKYWMESLARIVATPLRDSESMAKIGDRARPSNRFSSRVLVTKMLRTRRKYHTNGGNTTKANGRTVIVVAIAPTTRKNMTMKSNSVCGKRSSLEPTSAENRFKMRPNGFVSKNAILDRSTDLVISSCRRCDALMVSRRLRNARKMERTATMDTRPMIGATTAQSSCSEGSRSAQRPIMAMDSSTDPCVKTKITSMNTQIQVPPMALK